MNTVRRIASGLFVVALCNGGVSAEAASKDARALSSAPSQVYGKHGDAIMLRIDNDGAGSSGVLGALSRDYIATHHFHGAIAWYQDSDVNALAQLRHGHVDMAILADRQLVDAAVQRQFVTHPTEVFGSRFALVGPRSNPAKIGDADSITFAMHKIHRFGNSRVAKGGAPIFLSRDDRSANNQRERELWARAGVAPWVSRDLWYRSDHVFAPQALIDANHEELYTLNDYAAWTYMESRLPKLRLYIASGSELEKPDIAVLRPYPSMRVRAFLDYLKSSRAQRLIAHYGKWRAKEGPLFLPKATK